MFIITLIKHKCFSLRVDYQEDARTSILLNLATFSRLQMKVKYLADGKILI